MRTDFDLGYCREPFAQLCRDYPDQLVYPASDFRIEWGPVFHRGRLDDSARVLVIGQDPAQHEQVVRRILVGVAGHRVQGFLAKLGIERSHMMINTFLYTVYGQQGGEQHRGDPGIAAYRNRWLDALLEEQKVEAVLALGGPADSAWSAWRSTEAGSRYRGAYIHITHPTQPESSSRGNRQKLDQAIKKLLQNWNAGLEILEPALRHPDQERELVPYGEAFAPGDLVAIPAADLPAGCPAWMRSPEPWAARTGNTAQAQRFTITIMVPPPSSGHDG